MRVGTCLSRTLTWVTPADTRKFSPVYQSPKSALLLQPQRRIRQRVPRSRHKAAARCRQKVSRSLSNPPQMNGRFCRIPRIDPVLAALSSFHLSAKFGLIRSTISTILVIVPFWSSPPAINILAGNITKEDIIHNKTGGSTKKLTLFLEHLLHNFSPPWICSVTFGDSFQIIDLLKNMYQYFCSMEFHVDKSNYCFKLN